MLFSNFLITSDLYGVPARQAPEWVIPQAIDLESKTDLVLVTEGYVPLGIVPEGTLLFSEEERVALLKTLDKISAAKYDNVASDQQVSSWGQPLVDSPTVSEHLELKVDPQILSISNPLRNRVGKYLRDLGFDVQDLVDPLTGKTYHAGVLRHISVSKSSSVLHIDDFIRDGMKKTDFRLPIKLLGQEYYQISFNILLEDGGYQPDPLYCYNRFYRSEDEQYCMENGWQFPVSLMEGSAVLKYQPRVGEAYVFSTSAYHDIYGGSPKANRITWSVFAIYVPVDNLMLLYN